MSKLFSSIIFSLFLLFQTTALAEEDTAPTETNIEEPEVQEQEAAEETEPEEQADTQEVEDVEPKEEVSEAEKEAQAAEEAELREAGMGEEPLLD